MHFHAGIADQDDTLIAADALIAAAERAMNDPPDVLFLFFTGNHAEAAAALVDRIQDALRPACLIGCSAEGVIGADREIERSAGISLLAAQLPGACVHPFHISKSEWRELLTNHDALGTRLGRSDQMRAIIGLGDPFTTPLRQWLPKLDDAFPGAPLVGGMASSARAPGGNVLIHEGAIRDEGFVGVTLHGPVEVETVVSQGCRPIGQSMIITKARENMVEQLGGRPALAALQEVLSTIPDEEQQLLRNGLFMGLAISEYRERFGRGDFLVRNVIGIDREKGGIALADLVRVGQTVQFHVRDADTADEDLTLLLAAQKMDEPAAGGLLFSCNGRGARMFAEASHDIGRARESMPEAPIAGFFAAGELGPVGNRNFVHGHTASFALFRPIR